jgi:hypothetical protein
VDPQTGSAVAKLLTAPASQQNTGLESTALSTPLCLRYSVQDAVILAMSEEFMSAARSKQASVRCATVCRLLGKSMAAVLERLTFLAADFEL